MLIKKNKKIIENKKIILSYENWDYLISSLRVRLIVRMCIVVALCVLIALILSLFHGSFWEIMIYVLLCFLMLIALDLILVFISFFCVITNKIIFKKMNAKRKIRFFDCKCDLGGNQIYYFKEDLFCKVIIFLDK